MPVSGQTTCGWTLLAEGRICDAPAVGIYHGLGGDQPVCVAHADHLRRAWGIRVTPIPDANGPYGESLQ